MNNEVKVPEIPLEVAEAIESYRKDAWSNRRLINCALLDGAPTTSRSKAVKDFANVHLDDFLSALVNGYSVEKSAEELAEEALHNRIRNAHHRKMAEGIFEQRGQALGFADGIKFTLNELNVKITEVNA